MAWSLAVVWFICRYRRCRYGRACETINFSRLPGRSFCPYRFTLLLWSGRLTGKANYSRARPRSTVEDSHSYSDFGSMFLLCSRHSGSQCYVLQLLPIVRNPFATISLS